MNKIALAFAVLIGFGLSGVGTRQAQAASPYYCDFGGHGGHSLYTYPSHYGWHDTSHYHWRPGQYYLHGNHWHYTPGRYDLHRSGHWHYGHHGFNW